MKKHFIFAAFAFLFVAGSLSAQSGSQEQSEATVSVRAADCVCEVVTLAAKLKREIDDAPEEQRAALTEKAAKLLSSPTCMQELEAEIKKIPQELHAEMEAEMKALTKIKCGEAMKELGMPDEEEEE